MGRIKISGSGAQPQMTIKQATPATAPSPSTTPVEGQWVTAAQPGTAYDFNKSYVTARVDETDIDSVHQGRTGGHLSGRLLRHPGSPAW